MHPLTNKWCKDEPNIVIMRKSYQTSQHRTKNVKTYNSRGGSRRGGRTRRAPPLKFEKNKIFWRKIVIFHTKYPKNVRTSLRNWKKYDFLA
jgi:hypothetical protein